MICEAIVKKLKKEVKPKHNHDCQKAFDKIKEYLSNTPVLVPHQPGIPLILYPSITTITIETLA